MSELNHAHLQSLVSDRRAEITKRDAADAAVRRLNTQIIEGLTAAEKERVQLVSGTVIQIVRPAPRKNIVAEKLLEQAVAPEIIKHATVETPVTPFVRVDEPKVPKGAEVSVDTGEAVRAPIVPVHDTPDTVN